jgi:hypothetical protein
MKKRIFVQSVRVKMLSDRCPGSVSGVMLPRKVQEVIVAALPAALVLVETAVRVIEKTEILKR